MPASFPAAHQPQRSVFSIVWGTWKSFAWSVCLAGQCRNFSWGRTVLENYIFPCSLKKSKSAGLIASQILTGVFSGSRPPATFLATYLFPGLELESWKQRFPSQLQLQHHLLWPGRISIIQHSSIWPSLEIKPNLVKLLKESLGEPGEVPFCSFPSGLGWIGTL